LNLVITFCGAFGAAAHLVRPARSEVPATPWADTEADVSFLQNVAFKHCHQGGPYAKEQSRIAGILDLITDPASPCPKCVDGRVLVKAETIDSLISRGTVPALKGHELV
jgi:hypothetical protein